MALASTSPLRRHMVTSTPLAAATERPSERTDRGQHGEPSGLNWVERLACGIVNSGPIPQHVAFIMDGNRRFARTHGIEVARGHKLGYDKLEEVLRWCCELGVHGVTVYAFSIENFKRSPQEVDALMRLAEEGLREMSDETHLVQRRGVRVRVVGDLSRVSASLYGEMQRVMRMTQGNTRHTLTVCFSYTSRNEIASAVRQLGKACADGRLLPEDVSAELLEGCLCTSGARVPPVDLIVRTSGEPRRTAHGTRPRHTALGTRPQHTPLDHGTRHGTRHSATAHGTRPRHTALGHGHGHGIRHSATATAHDTRHSAMAPALGIRRRTGRQDALVLPPRLRPPLTSHLFPPRALPSPLPVKKRLRLPFMAYHSQLLPSLIHSPPPLSHSQARSASPTSFYGSRPRALSSSALSCGPSSRC